MGEVGLHLSELELSESDSDSRVASILGRFNDNSWMSDAEGAQDNLQVGAAAGVNDPGNILCRTTA